MPDFARHNDMIMQFLILKVAMRACGCHPLQNLALDIIVSDFAKKIASSVVVVSLLYFCSTQTRTTIFSLLAWTKCTLVHIRILVCCDF